MELTAAEIGLIRWYRGLNPRIRQAMYVWLLTGNVVLIQHQICHQRSQIAA